MKYLIFIIMIVCSFDINAQNQLHLKKGKGKKPITETEAVEEVRNLYENRDFLRHANKSQLPTVISDGLFENNAYYRVKVGYSKYMFRSSAIFDVNIKTGNIYYEDFQDSSGLADVPLKLWRKWRRDPRFNDLHTFRHGKLVAIKN